VLWGAFQPHLLQQVMRQMHDGSGGGNVIGGGGRGGGLSQAAVADLLSQLETADMAAVQERLPFTSTHVPVGVSPVLHSMCGAALQPSSAEIPHLADEVR
jgi:hypothetical protein